jgi:hypothetical protein
MEGLDTRSFELGYQCWRDKELNRSWDAGLTANEPKALEFYDHAVDRWRRHPEEELHVSFRRGAPVEFDVGVDEGEILALLAREGRHHGSTSD